MSEHIKEEQIVAGLTLDRPGFDPGQVDAALGKYREHIVQSAWPVQEADEQGCLVFAACRWRLLTKDQKAGRVASVVFNSLDNNLQVVGLDCK